jgi:hypothetical protein
MKKNTVLLPLALLIAACVPKLPDITGPLDLVDIRNNIHIVGSAEPDEENYDWQNATAWDDTFNLDFDGRYQVKDETTIDAYFEPPSYVGILPAAERAVFGNSEFFLYGIIEDDESPPDNVYCTKDDIERMIQKAQEINKPVFIAKSSDTPSDEQKLVIILVNQNDYDSVVSDYCPQDNSQTM